MAAEAEEVVTHVNGVVAQRLARMICAGCETKYFPSDIVLEDADLANLSGKSFKKGTGCQQCHDTGFRGRIGVYEVMEVTPEIRRLIHHQAPTHEIRATVQRQGEINMSVPE